MAKPGDEVVILVNGSPRSTYIDEQGVQRFFVNDVVRYIIDSGLVNLHDLSVANLKEKFDPGCYQEFYMCMGYSVCGFVEIFGPTSSWADNGNQPVDVINPLWLKDEKVLH